MKKKTPLSCIELSKKIFFIILNNLKFSQEGTKFSVVIKGNAYGHGQNLVKI